MSGEEGPNEVAVHHTVRHVAMDHHNARAALLSVPVGQGQRLRSQTNLSISSKRAHQSVRWGGNLLTHRMFSCDQEMISGPGRQNGAAPARGRPWHCLTSLKQLLHTRTGLSGEGSFVRSQSGLSSSRYCLQQGLQQSLPQASQTFAFSTPCFLGARALALSTTASQRVQVITILYAVRLLPMAYRGINVPMGGAPN